MARTAGREICITIEVRVGQISTLLQRDHMNHTVPKNLRARLLSETRTEVTEVIVIRPMIEARDSSLALFWRKPKAAEWLGNHSLGKVRDQRHSLLDCLLDRGKFQRRFMLFLGYPYLGHPERILI
jgi:hypothetical protein